MAWRMASAPLRTRTPHLTNVVIHFGTPGEEASQFLGRVMRSVCEAQLLGDFSVSKCLGWLTFSIQKGIVSWLPAWFSVGLTNVKKRKKIKYSRKKKINVKKKK